MTEHKNFDVIIIGGSYAGLSAAMSLGRALMQVLIIDGGEPCNKQTPYSHNFITQDGTPPAEIAHLAKAQVLKYEAVRFHKGFAVNGIQTETGFEITTASGEVFVGRKLIFATGVKDVMPNIRGFSACWGISAIHCPYCHGYEYKKAKTGILLNGDMARDYALFIQNWAGKLMIFTNGKSTIPAEQQVLLGDHHIPVIEKEIQEIIHTDGRLEQIVFTDNSKQDLEALYAHLPIVQHSTIPAMLGCKISEQGYIEVDEFKQTSKAGVYAAGDNTTPMRSVSAAVAAGTLAGVFASKQLISEKLK